MTTISGASTAEELRLFFKDTGGIHLHYDTNGWHVIRDGSYKCDTSECVLIKYVEVASAEPCIECGTPISGVYVRCKKCRKKWHPQGREKRRHSKEELSGTI